MAARRGLSEDGRYRRMDRLGNRARKLKNQEKYKEALRLYEEMRTIASDELDPEDIIEMGECYEKLRHYREALMLYEEVRLKFMTLLSSPSGLIRSIDDGEQVDVREAWNGYYDEAFGHSQRVRKKLGIEQLPNHKAVVAQIVQMLDGTFKPDVLFKQGKYEQALEGYLAADTETGISNPGTHGQIAQCYEKMGDLQRAIEHNLKVLEFLEAELAEETRPDMIETLKKIKAHFEKTILRLQRRVMKQKSKNLPNDNGAVERT